MAVQADGFTRRKQPGLPRCMRHTASNLKHTLKQPTGRAGFVGKQAQRALLLLTCTTCISPHRRDICAVDEHALPPLQRLLRRLHTLLPLAGAPPCRHRGCEWRF